MIKNPHPSGGPEISRPQFPAWTDVAVLPPAVLEHRNNWWKCYIHDQQVLLDPQLSAVLAAVLIHPDQDGICWPGPSRLARLAKCAPDYAKSAVLKLANLSLLDVNPSPDRTIYPRAYWIITVLGWIECWVDNPCQASVAPARNSNSTSNSKNPENSTNAFLRSSSLNSGSTPESRSEQGNNVVVDDWLPPDLPKPEPYVAAEALRLLVETRSKNDQVLSAPKAIEMLVVAQRWLREDLILPVIRRLSLVYASYEVRDSPEKIWGYWIKRHRYVHRGEDAMRSTERHHRLQSSDRQVNAAHHAEAEEAQASMTRSRVLRAMSRETSSGVSNAANFSEELCRRDQTVPARHAVVASHSTVGVVPIGSVLGTALGEVT